MYITTVLPPLILACTEA